MYLNLCNKRKAPAVFRRFAARAVHHPFGSFPARLSSSAR